MEARFWHERWQKGQTGFHQPDGSGALRRHLDDTLPGSGTVLVPLCGRSVDMIRLRDSGRRVLGVELSPIAVHDFFAAHDLEPREHEEGGGITRFCAAGIEILQGDFFEVTPSMCGTVDGVFDRAALVALPPSMRRQYVEHLLRLGGPAPILLVTLHYPPEQMDGPPFSVAPEEVAALFASNRSVRLLSSEDALPGEPRLRERGLTSLEESAWHLLPTE